MRICRLAAFLFIWLFLSGFIKWGFYGHRKITEMAIYTLPSGLIGFYKQHSTELIERSIRPDQRRYVIQEEGPRHYIDLDEYDHPDSIPAYWQDAVKRYGEQQLNENGLGPWYTYYTYQLLTRAFSEKDIDKIIRYSSDLSHYLADNNVPLHTTSNYNGQKTGQHGIHGFWETRLPQLFSNDYDFLVGRAAYVKNPQGRIWENVMMANSLVDSILCIEKEVTMKLGEDRKYAFENSGKRTVMVYSERFSREYHAMMPVVEHQMRSSIKTIGDFWFTAWVEAGQPELSELGVATAIPDTLEIKPAVVPVRSHEH